MIDAAERFPGHIAHQGTWTGTYRHLNAEGEQEQLIRSKVVCEFPASGGVFYRQSIELTHEAGAVHHAQFDGVARDDHVWFDTPTFIGRSWETKDGVILLNLQRKDEPGAHFVEAIIMADGGRHRARTWHWFKDGKLYRRTLCDETRLAADE